MKSARDILPRVYRSGRKGSEVNRELVLSYWPATVGGGIARRARPIGLFGKKLVVEVEDQTWQEQLEPLSRQIASRLNTAVGANVVQTIAFRVAGPAKIPPRSAGTATNPVEVADEAASIEDPALRRIYRASRKKAAGL